MLRVLVIFLFLTLPLHSEDEIRSKGPSEYDLDLETTTAPLANLDGEPSAIVNHSVNIITGNYCDSQVDLVISGPNPLVIERSYTSSIFTLTMADIYNIALLDKSMPITEIQDIIFQKLSAPMPLMKSISMQNIHTASFAKKDPIIDFLM